MLKTFFEGLKLHLKQKSQAHSYMGSLSLDFAATSLSSSWVIRDLVTT